MRWLVDEFVVVQSLVKDYPGGSRALGGLSFSLSGGEVYGLLGPNGAGKTTTVRILVGLLRPTAGRVRVGGFDAVTQGGQVRRLAGYTAQGSGVDIDLTVLENLRLRAALHGLGRAVVRRRSDEMLGRLGLDALASRRAGFLSGGQRRRLDLAMALVHEPTFVVLDEPTTGLDPQGRRALWDEVDSLRHLGRTVLLTTQYMEEADRLCSRVGIVDRGLMVAQGSPSALRAAAGAHVVVVDAATPSNGSRVEQVMRCVSGLGPPHVAGASVSAAVTGPLRTLGGLLGALDAARVAVSGMRVGAPTLEDAYLHHTGSASRDMVAEHDVTSLDVVLGASEALR